MFANFNLDDFPFVSVKFAKSVKNEEDFNNFLKHWIILNAQNKPYSLIFDTTNIGFINPKYAFKMADSGADLVLGIDISDISIENCIKSSQEMGVEKNLIFFQADCENTQLPNNSIDIIFCSGMLHHLDLSFAFPEMLRILKPGGRVLAIEALDYNPAIKLYRYLTPDMRTEWEKAHILSLKDINYAKKFFNIGEIKYWHVTSYIAGKFPSLLGLLNSIDKVLTKIPLLRLFAWIFTFELIKPKE